MLICRVHSQPPGYKEAITFRFSKGCQEPGEIKICWLSFYDSMSCLPPDEMLKQMPGQQINVVWLDIHRYSYDECGKIDLFETGFIWRCILTLPTFLLRPRTLPPLCWRPHPTGMRQYIRIEQRVIVFFPGHNILDTSNPWNKCPKRGLMTTGGQIPIEKHYHSFTHFEDQKISQFFHLQQVIFARHSSIWS